MRSDHVALYFLVLSGCMADAGVSSDGELGVSGATRLTWEAFYASVHRDAEGVWIVNGDSPIDTEKRLVDFYEQLVADQALTVARVGGRDSVWGSARKRSLTYCVSTSFGARYDEAVRAMARAAAEWEAVCDVDFIHVASEDDRCDASNDAVVFDVRPAFRAGYLARAFFPYQSRRSRNVIVDSSAFRAYGGVTLVGVLRHELGHALGFRHEHTRPEAGRCFEDNRWRAVTEYDRDSVMHYPQCNGRRGDFTISARDAAGAAEIYGPPRSGETDPDVPTPAPEPTSMGTPRSGSTRGSLEAGRSITFRGLSVRPETIFRARLGGQGDADLYVRWDATPTLRRYDCRPYRPDSQETCELRVPPGTRTANVLLNAYTDASYTLEATWVEP